MTQEQANDGYSAVLAEADAECAANAVAIATALYSTVTLADRLRHALGVTVVVETAACRPGAEPITGVVMDLAGDAVAIRRPGAPHGWVVMLAGVQSVAGLPNGHRGASGHADDRRTAGALLRPAVGCGVTIALRERSVSGLLERVGADHVQVRSPVGPVLMPLGAVCWIRCPVGDQFASMGSGLSLM